MAANVCSSMNSHMDPFNEEPHDGCHMNSNQQVFRYRSPPFSYGSKSGQMCDECCHENCTRCSCKGEESGFGCGRSSRDGGVKCRRCGQKVLDTTPVELVRLAYNLNQIPLILNSLKIRILQSNKNWWTNHNMFLDFDLEEHLRESLVVQSSTNVIRISFLTWS